MYWAIAMVALPIAVQAIAPPPDWRPSIYAGPGILRGQGFNPRLLKDETATAGYPSEGYISTDVKSHGGAFEVIAYEFNPPELAKTPFSNSGLGRVYIVDRVIGDTASGAPKRRSYWFEPASAASTPFSLDFHAADPGGQGEFPPSEYRSVIKPLSFAMPGKHVQCLSPSSPD